MYEMEQVLPGVDPEDFDGDPRVEANQLRASWLAPINCSNVCW
jgi:hypothetical protein